MPLTDTAIRNAKPGEKPSKLSDERGLFLLVTPAGGKWWRLKYRFDGKEKLLSLGTYPDVGLKAARERRDDARKLLADGIDPGENRKASKAAKQERAANSFEVVAREWYAKMAPNWAEHHGDRIIRRFERDIFPWIGGWPIADVTAPELLAAVRHAGADIAYVTLHVGAGTFQPVRSENLSEHRMHSERYRVPAATARAMARTHERGGRVFAVGTTALRALESAALGGALDGVAEGPDAGEWRETDLFVTPGFRFRVVDALLTNFHLPRSTLLMLVSAFAGIDEVRAAYRHAIAAGYRFFSYGDAMLLRRREVS